MFLGLDLSTQSLSALIADPATGRIVAETSVNFGTCLPGYGAPSGFIPGGKDGEVHASPLMWLDAMEMLFDRLQGLADLSCISAVACSGQQHGSVFADASLDQRLADLDPALPLSAQLAGALTRETSPIWMDTSTAAQCAEISAASGGDREVCRRTGSIPVERFTGPQIRRFFQTRPEEYARTARIHLVSSFAGSVLAGRSIAIDTGDGAGMNLLCLESSDWDQTLLDATAPDLRCKLPPVSPSASIAGNISPWFVQRYGLPETCRVVLSTGDNPSSLIGMGAASPGTAVISLGTSDTFFAAMEKPVTDPQGYGHVFGNPAGGFMSLICFLNGSLAREALKDSLGLGWDAFDRAGLALTPPGNDGNRMLPFAGPEITPRRSQGGLVRRGSPIFESGGNSAGQVRALLEGQFLNMRLHSRWIGEKTEKIRLTGGASRNDGMAQLAADIFQAPVERFAVANGAALGAALRAAHACGHDLQVLEERFCRPVPDSRLEPDRKLAGLYEEALADFATLL